MNKDQISALSIEKFYQDLDFLMKCFREVLEEQGEPELAVRVPWINRPRLDEPPSILRELQAYSVAFQLLNMVEENTAAQTRRRMESDLGPDAERGLWAHRLRAMIAAGLQREEIESAVRQAWVEPVLTAHPSEAKRNTVLEQHRELYLLLFERESQVWTRAEQDTIRQRIKTVLERLWHTGEVYLEKPDIKAERDNILYYLREVFPSVLGRLDIRLRQAWEAVGLPAGTLARVEAYPRLTFGTWVGGDRDGHPKVTAEVTAETLEELRRTALELVGESLDRLARHLSLSALYDEPPAELNEAVARAAELLGDRGREIVARHPMEPWRQFAHLMTARVPSPHAEAEVRETDYARFEDLDGDLDLLHRSLLDVEAHRVILYDLLPVRRLVRVFGFHLASLDIRQNSGFHDRALAQILASAGMDGADFADWPASRRIEFCLRELESRRPFGHDPARLGPEATAVLDCYRVLAEHLRRYGRAGIGSLIVSMTRDASDLFVVYLLAREAGLMTVSEEGIASPFPVVPLLERVEDLRAGASILEAFLAHPVTRRSLALWGATATQEIMVGYSDSGKESGILASQLELHCAQRELSETAERHGVQARFFHGRGGTVSRGSGPTSQFLEALPPGAFSGAMRMTEQGETIAQKYANQGTASYNLELLLAGVGSRVGLSRFDRDADDRARDTVRHLADRAGEVYRDLILSPGFLDFFAEATPIDVIEQARIGSRPTRRTGRRTLGDLRAIPWVFSWTQARFYVPGWYGVGTAVGEMMDGNEAFCDELAHWTHDWPFVRYVLTSVETSLMSANLDIMRRYADLVSDAAVRDAVFGMIESEYHRTRDVMDMIFGAALEARRPRLWRTLNRREGPMRVLHERQIVLLRRRRRALADGDDQTADSLLPVLLLSINAIAGGLRTTG